MIQKGTRKLRVGFAIIALPLFFSLATSAQIVPRQFLTDHVPAAVASSTPIGRLADTERLNLAISLPLRDPDGLDSLNQQLCDPASPKYRQFLTPEEFTEMFGPTEEDYQTLIAFAQANGLTVTTTHPNRLLLDVSASAADIERVFHVTMRTYQHPTEARTFYAPDVEPSVDLALPILHISGLDNFSLPHPNYKVEPDNQTAGAAPSSGSGSGGSFLGNDFRAAYLPGVTTNQLSGVGQTVALLQFDGYFSNDIVTYENAGGLPRVTLTNVPIDGGVSSPSLNGSVEVSLDIEMVICMAPNVKKVILYEAPNPSPFADILSRMANDNLAKQISCSWSGGPPDPASEQIFKQMISQGQSFFCASGDSDAYTGTINFPEESTNITEVGGTTLSTTGPGGAYVSETVWNFGNGAGSSGGISPTYSIPSWQQGVSTPGNQGSTTKRNIPDVALTADNIRVVYGNGHVGTFGGTSCASPLWAAFIALVNQQALAGGQPPVGFVNPAIYAIGKGANYTTGFHDTITGNNFRSGSPTKFAATNGYDLCTGWGTPNGINLVSLLSQADTLGVLPATGFTAIGPVGGPFNVTSENFSLTNSTGASLNWSLFGVPPWLDASLNGGTLAAGGYTNLILSLNATASSLPAGTYTANLSISNASSGVNHIRTFVLKAGQSLVQNGDFESGNFSPWTLVGSGPNINFVDSGNDIAPHGGNFDAALGQNGFAASLSQNLPTQPGQNYLLSFWLANPGNSDQPTKQFFVNWNTNSTSTNTIYSLINPSVFNYWTNLSFAVTATGTNTVLQFRVENDIYWFNLDDIVVQPVPPLSFRAATQANGAFTFTWASVSNVAYQVQYSTDLAQGNWINLGGPITATNNATSTNDVIGPDQQRFYRVHQLP